MRRIYVSFLVILFFTSFAKTYSSQGSFYIAGEWLYMLDAIDRPFYSVDFDLATSTYRGKQHANHQGWHSGYRIEGGYQFDELPAQLLLRWTHFPQFSNSNTSFGEQLSEVGLPYLITEFSINDTFNFYSFEFIYDYLFFQNCSISLFLQIGFQQAYIGFKENAVGSGADIIDVTNRSKRWGLGPEIGLGMHYALCDRFSILARANASLLAMKKKTSIYEVANGIVDVDLKDDPYWLIIPAVDLRIGLSYCQPFHPGQFCNCFHFNVEAGYEFISYLRGLDRYSIYDAQNMYMSFMLHGPFLRLDLLF